MSIKVDAAMGLQGTVHADREDVIKAAKKAVDALGSHAEASAGAAKLTVGFYPGLVRAFSSRSPVVGVDLAPGEGGCIIVRANIESYRSVRQRVYWIPVTPKRMIGKRTAKSFLRALKQELEAIDNGKGSVELVGLRT